MASHKSAASYRSFQGRMLARKFAMQALYQLDIRDIKDMDSQKIAEDFSDEPNFTKADVVYFKRLLEGCQTYADEIENLANKAMNDTSLRQVDPIEKALIKSAICEMVFLRDMERSIVIAEAIRLARKFGSENGFRFVNGVLDKIDIETPE